MGSIVAKLDAVLIAVALIAIAFVVLLIFERFVSKTVYSLRLAQ